MNIKNKFALTALFAALVSASAISDEVPNGSWTDEYQKISEVESVWSFTYFRISEATSCGTGNDHIWRIQNVHSNQSLQSALDYKKSMLLAAFMAQKDVKFRCENGFITDFTVRN